MQTVITIQEDNHGLIGIAKNYISAIDFLIKQNWLDEKYEVLVDDAFGLTESIAYHLGESWKDIIKNNWDIEQFNMFFEGSFYLNIEEVYGAD